MRFIDKTVLFFLFPSFLVSPVFANNIDTLNEYNGKYIEIIEAQAEWEQSLLIAKEKVQLATLAYEESLTQTQPAQEVLDFMSFELETQKAHLAFLDAMIPMASDLQKQVQVEAAKTSEFNQPKDVTLLSLSQRSKELVTGIEVKDQEIAEQEANILDVKMTPDYIAVDGGVSNAKNQVRLAANFLQQLKNQQDDLEDDLSDTEAALADSKSRQADAENQETQIKVVLIPTVNSHLDRREEERDEIQAELREVRPQIRNLKEREIPKKQTALSNVTAKLQALPADAPEQKRKKLQERKSKIEGELATLRANLSSLQEQRRQLRVDLDDKKRRIERLENRLEDLEDELLEARQTVAEEINLQRQLRQNIADIEDEILDNQSDQLSAESRLGKARNDLKVAQAHYDQFYKANIKPFDDEILRLQGLKRTLQARLSKVENWIARIVRQDGNIASLKDRMDDQIAVVTQAEQNLQQAEQDLSASMQKVIQEKANVNTQIQAFNVLVQQVNQKVDSFRAAEQKILTIINEEQ